MNVLLAAGGAIGISATLGLWPILRLQT
jgi:hypothetical protein